jgi:hypothetical protein
MNLQEESNIYDFWQNCYPLLSIFLTYSSKTEFHFLSAVMLMFTVLSTPSKASLTVRHTSARITSEVNNNNNNMFSTWIQVFWNVTPCPWMSVPDFSTKTAWPLMIKALPSFHTVVTARPPTRAFRRVHLYWTHKSRKEYIVGLLSQNPRHFAWQPSARVSPNLRPSYLSHVTVVLRKRTNTGTSTALTAKAHSSTRTRLRAPSRRVTSA